MEAEKIRLIIRKYISEQPRNSAEIATWLSGQKGYSGSLDLASLMETDTSIVRIGTVRKSGMAGSTPPLSEWATEEWVQHHERAKPDNK
ncbi:MAG: DUF3860 domain-containing protein [Candidatus Poseidoniales archaeon]|jgi:hypothetical protein|nr:DUF3860 domain-containing protein [Candidatus Poseidoniales archaeon]|tara:strand:+ start:12043 stop:12309 length:267 start_codon:yes stop_codon:yes gene_type:complete